MSNTDPTAGPKACGFQAFCQPLKKPGILHRRQPAGARCLHFGLVALAVNAQRYKTDGFWLSIGGAAASDWRSSSSQRSRKMAGLVGGDGKLIAIIGDEDTVTGFVLAGVGHRTAESSNFLVVKEGTPLPQIEKAFLEFTNRDDVGIVLVNQHVAAQIRHLLDDYSKTIPTVLEMPSKDMPYDPAQDYIMQRVSAMLNTGD